MNLAELIEDIRVHGALSTDAIANDALWAVVSAVAPSIQPEDRRALPAALPGPVQTAVRTARYVGPMDEEAFYESVASHLALTPGRAREVGQVVLRELSSRLSPTLRDRLARHAGPSMAWLWRQPHEPPPPAPRPASARGHTLASGRPGSSRPLSEAQTLAHQGSVAVADNPHGDRKLSSAKGYTAEQEHRTLAEGRPGPEHSSPDEPD